MVRSMPRRRCLEYGLLLVAAQLAITATVVWYFKTGHDSVKDPDQRLLLSVDDYSSSSARDRDDTFSSGTAFDFDPYAATLDRYRLFKTKMFTVTGSDWAKLSQERKVCLGAQTSIDRSHWLIQMADHWTGPISIALFVPDVEHDISKVYLSYMRRCFPSIAKQVSFHFTFPVEHPVRDSEQMKEINPHNLPCDQPQAVLKSLVDTRSQSMLKWREKFAYPQNLLRNVAKSGCQSLYTFIPDIDMIPIKGLDLDLDKFLSDPKEAACDKCAYVIPTYEIHNNVTNLPENKKELLELIHSKLARKFHQVVYKINQQSSKLEEWEKIPMGDELARAYNVTKYQFKYEPLYVAKADTPIFDERFIGFGMTRNTQVYEMYVAGYTFLLLNNAFTNHWGFQTIKQRPAWRAKQQEANNKKVDEFALELIAKYGKDPYNMKEKLKKYNFKNIRVAYGAPAAKKQPAVAKTSSSTSR